jgi:hypothetical protein
METEASAEKMVSENIMQQWSKGIVEQQLEPRSLLENVAQ